MSGGGCRWRDEWIHEDNIQENGLVLHAAQHNHQDRPLD